MDTSLSQMSFKRPGGDISTLLDLANRDEEDNDFFPLDTQVTWFTRSPDRRTIPFVPVIQDFPFRGPASYGQRFTFDIGSLPCGDLMLATAVQIKLSHWLDLTTQLNIASGKYTYTNPDTAFFFANSLGSSLIEKAELEADGVTIETIDGDFINVFTNLNSELNSQFGLATDSLGSVSIQDLLSWNPARNYPVEDGNIFCLLPFFFMRNRMRESFPMVALKEGSAKIHITFRPFDQVIRQRRGYRDTCTSIPLDTNIQFNIGVKTITQVIPDFQQVKLITYGAYLDGIERNKMLRDPFEHLIREVQIFSFDEPLKYAISKSSNDTVTIQLPIEANHPLEEIIWFVRRKEVANNNEWTNYSAVLEREYDSTFNPFVPMLKKAILQVNGQTICDAPETYYRQLISSHHKSGYMSYKKYIYGYPFANHPSEEHQPSGSLNASRVQNLRLTLEVQQPSSQYDVTWEVKVFCIGLNWLKFENGICNKLFSD
jgi:hypothetical protein